MSTNPLSWSQARAIAVSAAEPVQVVGADPEQAIGSVLAEPLVAQSDIPAYDTARTDGWAVSGPGPWRVRKATRRDMFAGLDYHESSTHTRIHDGQAVPITAGEAIGPGVTAVVDHQRATLSDGLVALLDRNQRNRIELGSGIRLRGNEAAAGDSLIPAGKRVTAAVAALATLSGNDEVTIHPMPRVGIVRIGEVLDTGIPRYGLRRDGVSPAISTWIAGLGGRAEPARWVRGGDGELIETIEDLLSDTIVTVGPAAGAAFRRVLPTLGADILISDVACEPGGSMALARLPDGRNIVHCGDMAIEAMVTLLTLLAPMIEGAAGRPDPARRSAVREMIVGNRYKTVLLPGRLTGDRLQAVDVVRPGGPGGLLALARADCLLVVPPGGVTANEPVTVLPMP